MTFRPSFGLALALALAAAISLAISLATAVSTWPMFLSLSCTACQRAISPVQPAPCGNWKSEGVMRA